VLLQSGMLTLNYIFELSLHKKSIANALKEGVYDSRLVCIDASKYDLMKWENDHEFFLNGEKYDVVSIITVMGKVTYKCINDKTEKGLINKLAGSEKKSSAVNEILKKLNLHLNSFNRFETLKYFSVIKPVNALKPSCYSFIFLRSINKPPTQNC
jgi:hypothetical protein